MADSSGGADLLNFFGSVFSEMYGQALSSAMSQYRLFEPSFALQRDIAAYEKLNRDPVVSHATYLRKLGAAGTRWSVVPSAPSHLAGAAAKLTEGAVNELDDFLALRFNLGEGIVQGSRWARVWWETRKVPVPEGVTLKGGQRADEVELVCPVVHRDVDKRRLRQYRVTRPDVQRGVPDGVTEDGELYHEKQVEFPWQVWRPVQRVWQDKDLVDDGGTWIHHVVDDTENSLGYGNGVADATFTAAWARGQVLQYMLSGLERWAQGGILLAEVQAIVDGELAGGRYEAAKAQFTKTLQAAMRSGVVAFPSGDKLSILAPSEAWLNECITVLRYLDGIITQRILMSVLPSGGGSETGSLARAQEEGGTAMRVTLHDRARIQDTLDRDVLKVFWARNQETLALLEVAGRSLDSARPGSIRLGSDGARESLAAVKDLVELVKVAPVRIDEFYERCGLTPPRPEDKVVYLQLEAAKADKFEEQAKEEGAKAERLDPTGVDAGPSKPDEAQRRREDARYGAGLESRRDMPQVKDLDALAAHLRANGVGVSDEVATAGDLNGSQEEINQAKVDRLKARGLGGLIGRRLLVSQDDYVIDGHHWNEATKALDPAARVPVRRVGLPRDAAIEAVRSFPGAEFKGPRDGRVSRDNEEAAERRREAAYVALAAAAGLLEFEGGAAEFAAQKPGGQRGYNLVYAWIAKCDPNTCKGCAYLAKSGPFTWGTLPTFPGTADTPCGGRCRCVLRARPASKVEHDKLQRRVGSGARLERIEALTGWTPPTLGTLRGDT